jgi:uncharacterized membrane protein (DUF485 family)
VKRWPGRIKSRSRQFDENSIQKESEMTTQKSEPYGRKSARAGMFCSCMMVFYFFILLVFNVFRAHLTTWLGVGLGVVERGTLLAALVSAILCITAAISNRKNPDKTID